MDHEMQEIDRPDARLPRGRLGAMQCKRLERIWILKQFSSRTMRSGCPFHCRSAPTIPNTWRYLKQNKGPDQNHPRRPHPRPAIAPVAALPESSVALPGLAAALLELAAALPGLPAALPELAAACSCSCCARTVRARRFLAATIRGH